MGLRLAQEWRFLPHSRTQLDQPFSTCPPSCKKTVTPYYSHSLNKEEDTRAVVATDTSLSTVNRMESPLSNKIPVLRVYGWMDLRNQSFFPSDRTINGSTWDRLGTSYYRWHIGDLLHYLIYIFVVLFSSGFVINNWEVHVVGPPLRRILLIESWTLPEEEQVAGPKLSFPTGAHIKAFPAAELGLGAAEARGA